MIVGLPLNLDGTDGPAAKGARRVAKALQRRVAVPVVLWDERLTTMQAERTRRERGVKGRAGIDAEAAAILLQSYVERAGEAERGEHAVDAVGGLVHVFEEEDGAAEVELPRGPDERGDEREVAAPRDALRAPRAAHRVEAIPRVDRRAARPWRPADAVTRRPSR